MVGRVGVDGRGRGVGEGRLAHARSALGPGAPGGRTASPGGPGPDGWRHLEDPPGVWPNRSPRWDSRRGGKEGRCPRRRRVLKALPRSAVG